MLRVSASVQFSPDETFKMTSKVPGPGYVYVGVDKLLVSLVIPFTPKSQWVTSELVEEFTKGTVNPRQFWLDGNEALATGTSKM